MIPRLKALLERVLKSSVVLVLVGPHRRYGISWRKSGLLFEALSLEGWVSTSSLYINDD